MPERPTDLDAICEALEAVAPHVCSLLCLEEGKHWQSCVNTRAALAIAKRLRDAAVEGWAYPATAEDLNLIRNNDPHLTIEVCGFEQTVDADVRCLLIPLADDPEKPDA
jgi:hypothetical protein